MTAAAMDPKDEKTKINEDEQHVKRRKEEETEKSGEEPEDEGAHEQKAEGVGEGGASSLAVAKMLAAAAAAAGMESDAGGAPTQPDSETRLRLAESEVRLLREQQEALRARLGEAALWAAEAARMLGAERRRGRVKSAAVANLEEQHRSALAAADELRMRLDAVAAERAASARGARLLKDEVADLKQQLQMQGKHLSCQLDLESAAVKYQGRIKEYLLLICRNVKLLEEEQEMLKQSVTKVSNISQIMEKGINHYSCKEKMCLNERKELEKKIVELGAELESLKLQSTKTNAERNQYYEDIVSNLQHHLKNEAEKNAKLMKKIKTIQCTEVNYEQKIEELIHQIHEKKEQIEFLGKEKADLLNMLKHNEREMEILERKHKYELDYASQKPLVFSCETQTEPPNEETSNSQTNISGCALCCARMQNVYQHKCRTNNKNSTPNNYSFIQSSIINIPASQNMEAHGSDPFLSHYNRTFIPFFTVPSTEPNCKTVPISLDSLGPVDDYNDVQWYSRRNYVTDNLTQWPGTTNQNTESFSLTCFNSKLSIPSSECTNQITINSNFEENRSTIRMEKNMETETSEAVENMISSQLQNEDNEIPPVTNDITSDHLQTQSYFTALPKKETILQNFKMTHNMLANASTNRVLHNIELEQNTNKNSLNITSALTSSDSSNVTAITNIDMNTSESADTVIQNTKLKRRVLKVLH